MQMTMMVRPVCGWLWIVGLLAQLCWLGQSRAERTLFFDRAEYLAAISAGDYSQITEGFESDDAWGLARSSVVGGTMSVPDVLSRGVTWNGSGGGIHGVTTSNGAASQGEWGFYSSPHTDLPAGIRDGYVVSAPTNMYGFGGAIRGTFGADIVLIIDGNTAAPVDLGEICEFDSMGEPFNCVDRNLDNTPFFAILDTDGFSQIEVRETEAGGDEVKYLFSDRFTMAFQSLPSPRMPGTAWNQATGGGYATGANWEGGQPPTVDSAAIFRLGSSTAYTVALSADAFARQVIIANDKVRFDLGDCEYQLSEANITRASLVVAELPGDHAEWTLRHGTVSGVHGVVARTSGAEGTLTLDIGASLVLAQQLRVGAGGQGTLRMLSGSSLSTGTLVAGQFGGHGTIEVNGNGTSLAASTVLIADSGNATLNVGGGAELTSTQAVLGRDGDATAVLDGAMTTWSLSIPGSSRGTLRVGGGTSSVNTPSAPTRIGSLTVQNGATVSSEESYVGDERHAQGLVHVTGVGSTWNSNTSGNLFVGHAGNGQLDISMGGTVHSGQVLIGRMGVLGETRGVANVTGSGSVWQTASLWVGYNFTSSTFSNVSDGELNISAGGSVSASQLYVGARNAAHGSVHVQDAGSTIIAGGVQIGPSGAGVFNNQASLIVSNDGLVDVNGTLTLANGRIELHAGQIQATLVNINRGRLLGEGHILADVVNRSLLEPGSPAGMLEITGSYEQLAAGILAIDMGGHAAGMEFDTLHVTGPVQLDGRLKLARIDLGEGLFAPNYGDQFDLLRASETIEGQFSEVVGVSIDDDLGFAVTYGTNEVRAIVALLGDANLDSIVDTSDFNIWNENKFLSGTTWVTGDFNGDGQTDTSDFNLWNAHKFTSADSFALVPEPSPAMLLLLGICLARHMLSRRI